MVKIAVCAGHGGNGSTAGKRTPDGEYEWNFNDKVVRSFISEIEKYKDVEVRRMDDTSGITDILLKTRTDEANKWGADVYISFHHNANTGKWGNWTGVETHVYKTKPSDAVRLAKLVQPELVKAYGLRDRGIKYTNLHITRETKMTAILVEGGFMDSTIDIKKLRNDSVLKNAGKGVADAVVKFYGLKKDTIETPKEQPKNNEMYRVRKSWSDVKSQIGAFSVLDNAKGLADKNKGYHVFDSKGEKVYSPTSVKEEVKTSGTPIVGKSKATLNQMVDFVKKNNKDFDPKIAEAFLKVGEKYNVRGDIALAQSIIETGWFKFTGGTAVTPDQHNYCGMGVTSKGKKGNSFNSIEEGVTAQIQHLFAYATKDDIPKGEELVDPRYKYVKRGIAPNWEDLSMRWAMNKNYGAQILNIFDDMMKTPIRKEEPKQKDNQKDNKKDNPKDKEPISITTHTIQRGDTLWALASKYNTTVQKLEELNKGIQAKALQVGGKIIVPSNKKEASKPEKKDILVGRVKGNVWLHSTPDYKASSRKRVLKTGEAYKVYGEKNGMYDLGGGYTSKKYIDIVGREDEYDLPSVTLRRGSRGVNVSKIQRALNKLNFKCGGEDGVFGARTQDAVKRFQMVYDAYNVTGVYDSRVEKKMEEQLKKQK